MIGTSVGERLQLDRAQSVSHLPKLQQTQGYEYDHGSLSMGEVALARTGPDYAVAVQQEAIATHKAMQLGLSHPRQAAALQQREEEVLAEAFNEYVNQASHFLWQHRDGIVAGFGMMGMAMGAAAPRFVNPAPTVHHSAIPSSAILGEAKAGLSGFVKEPLRNVADLLKGLSLFSAAINPFNPKADLAAYGVLNRLESPGHALGLNSAAQQRGAFAFDVSSIVAVGIFGGIELAARGVGVVGAKGFLEIKTLASPRDFYLSKVEHPKLYRIVDRLYRPAAKFSSGSTADAVRHELSTGELLSRTSHIQKAIESRNALSDLIRSKQLSASDTQVAVWIREDLHNALTEQPWNKIYSGRQEMRS